MESGAHGLQSVPPASQSPASSPPAGAAHLRRFAEEAPNRAVRDQFLSVAAQYDKLVQRAEQRAAAERQERQQGCEETSQRAS